MCTDKFAAMFCVRLSKNSVWFGCAAEYDWCTVPDSGYDALLFPAIAVVLACLFQGRMSTTLVLIAGQL